MSRLSKRTTRKPRSASSAQKLLVPGDHLRRQPHDQQQRLAVGVAHLLVGELDPVGGRQPLFAEALIRRSSQLRQPDSASASPAKRASGRRCGDAHGDRLRPAPRRRQRRGPAARPGDPRACCSRRSPAPTASSCSATWSSCATCRSAPALELRPALLRGAGRGDGRARGRRSSPATTTTASPSRCSKSSRSAASRARARAPRAPPPAPAADDRRLARRGRAAASPTRASGCATTSTPPTATTWTAT